MRVSREDGDKIESDSIGNQRRLIENHVAYNLKDITITEYYSDDNFTGTNFNRPGFQQMYKDILSKKIDCVIVKDLSRLGRDYIDVGRYLQKEFPVLGVRFIAIGDNIDSAKREYDMLMPMKNIFNEQYARDISTKIISTFRTKQTNGQFIGAFACYGYSKDCKYKLIIDEYAAMVVSRIFKLFNEGHGKIAIAKILNNDEILCPSEYKKSIGLKYCNPSKLGLTSYWTYSTINKILRNEMYTGNMVQHKSNMSKYDCSSKQVEKKSWIIAQNTHEAIIDKNTWDTTQELLKRRTRELPLTENVSVAAGFLACGDCGRAMSKITSGGNISYVCGTYKRYTKAYCSSHRIGEDVLFSIIIKDINKILRKIQCIKKIIDCRKNRLLDKSKCKNNISNISKMEIQLNKVKHMKKSIYEDYKMGLLNAAEFVEYKEDYDKQGENAIKILNELKLINKAKDETIMEDPYVITLLSMKQANKLDRVLLETFYDKIYIYEGKIIKFKYKHQELIEGLMELY